MIVIIDYGLGNLASIRNMIRKAGGKSTISGDPEVIRGAEKLILPGVGHFGAGMENIRSKGLEELLNEKVIKQGVPVLGICLGMQLMARHSEEGDARGLGWFEADVVHFDTNRMDGLKVPHMGWNDVAPMHHNSLIVPGEAYFLHSYHFVPTSGASAAAMTDHGGGLVAAVARDNKIGRAHV